MKLDKRGRGGGWRWQKVTCVMKVEGGSQSGRAQGRDGRERDT